MRNDDSVRPHYAASKQAATYFQNITSVSKTSQGTAQIVTMTTSDNKRVIALWNNSPAPMTASIKATRSSALKVTQPTEANPNGSTQTIYPSGGSYNVYLPGATCNTGASGQYIVGGMTYILVESGSTPPPSSAVPTGLIENGDFELTPDFDSWMLGGSTAPQLTSSAYRGGRAAILGQSFVPDPSGGGNSTIWQVVGLPSSASNLSLDFALALDTNQPPPADPTNKSSYDFFEVLLDDSTAVRKYLYTTWSKSGWRNVSLDLSPWRGQTVTLTFTLWQSSADYPTIARLDAVSIWPHKTFLPMVSRN